jgi:hypothetical protein
LVIGLVVIARSVDPTAAHAQPAPAAATAGVFGVPLGAPDAALRAAVLRAGLTCTLYERGFVVCPAPLAPAPLPATETLWLAHGVVDRAFLVATVRDGSFDAHEKAFGALFGWLSGRLGAPTTPVTLPAWWSSRAIDDRRKLDDIVSGRATLEALWTVGDTAVRLWLAGENGRPSLVVGMGRGLAGADCSPASLNDALLNLFPPAAEDARAAAAQRLAACRVTRAAGALGAALEHDPAGTVRAEALRALDHLGAGPDDAALAHLRDRAPPALADAAAEIAAARRQRATAAAEARLHAPPRPAPPASAPVAAGAPARAPSAAPPATAPRAAAPTTAAAPAPGAPAASAPMYGPKLAAAAPSPALAPAPAPIAPAPPAAPAGPVDGTALAIGASTAAGAVLMRNLGSMGLSDPSAQLLIGGAGAVIGFGTSWGLSRFGFRPTLGQAAWFTNTTAWGTLAGLTAWGASGSTSTKLEYGSLVLGEAAGMGLGVWSARRWTWTPEQAVLADTLLVGVGAVGLGSDRLRGETPHVSPAQAVATPAVMVAAALAAHQMNPTGNDLRLMSFGALGGAWTGGLLAAGAERTPLFKSHEGQGGLLIGAGAGYLGGALAGAFTEAPARQVAVSTGGIVAGNLLGLGVGMLATSAPTLTDADRDRWQLGAGIGGLALGAAAYAYAPRLQPGPSAVSMTLGGALYGGGTFWLASLAGYHGQPVTDTDTAHLEGGVLAGAVAGGVTGLIASRWFAPDAVDEATAFGAAGAGAAMGVGVAKLATGTPGAPDTAGVLAGAGVGLAAGWLVDRDVRLRAPDFGAAAVGAGYGAMIGALAPTLDETAWNGGRKTVGGTWLGLGAGAAGGAALAHALSARGAQVAVPAVAGVFGTGIGYGAGLLWGGDGSRPARIGTVVGPLALMGGAIALEPRLHLADGLGPSAAPMAGAGALYGGAWGLMLAGLLDPSGLVSGAEARPLGGGLLMGASAGMASGLVLSRFYEPSSGDLAFTFTTSALGGAFGLGVPRLAWNSAGRPDTLGTMLGSVGGLLGGAVLAPDLRLARSDIAAGVLGGGFGTLMGTLAPTMFDASYEGGRRTSGGAWVGLSVGAAGAAAAAHLSGASPARVGETGAAATLGLGAGLGAGLMWPGTDSRPARIGTVVGPLAFAGAAVLAEPRLRLAEMDGPNGARLATLGATYGIADGLMLAGAIDASGLVSRTPGRQLFGGALLGASVEGATGLVLSRSLTLDRSTAVVATGGKLFGGLLGAGTIMLAEETAGRDETVAALGGSLAGLAAAAVVEHDAPLEGADGAAVVTGVGFGGLIGALAPRLDRPQWPGADRATTGGALVGLSLGAFGGAAIRHVSGAPVESVGLTALGGVDGLMTGLGFGLIARDGESTRPLRVGMLAGTAAGLGIGMGVWPRVTLGPGDRGFIAAGTAVGGWTALWLPALGHASAGDVDGAKMGGALMAGAGVASYLTSFAAQRLQIDDDLVANATAMDLVFTGAGAGAGALASRRSDAPVWGLLGGGTAGLLLGGALHRSIDLRERDVPFLSLAAGEGIWLGAWLPYMLHQRDDVDDRMRAGALAAAALGATGGAALVSSRLDIDAADAGYSALGSAIGASVAGGTALLASGALSGREQVGLMLGGTGVGLLGGALLSPRLALDGASPAGAAAIGGALGGTEALLFAWSGRAGSAGAYGGSILIGAGAGTALGLATGASAGINASGTPASAGFAAWGAWMGSFTGSLIKVDPHEVVLGGLAGANLGFLGGYGLVHLGVVEPRDFGWLSLAGAIGTVAGAGAGAPFSSASDRRPILAGLAIGPAVGMLAGGLALPRLHRLASASHAPNVSVTSIPARAICGVRLEPTGGAGGAPQDGGDERVPDQLVTSADVLADGAARGFWSRLELGRTVKQVVEVTDWSPMLGALPGATPADPAAPSPLLLGVTGLWK